MLRECTHCGEKKELEKFVKGEIYKGTQYYRYQCKECLNKTLRTGRPNTGRFKKGQNNWLGRKHNEESKKKISEGHKGRIQSVEEKEKRRLKLLGRRRTSTRHASRKYWDWRDAVKEKNGWKCQHCGCQERKKLHAHHIVSWENDETKRFDVNNGLTLCKNCHAKEETKDRIGKSFLPKTEYKKGHVPWNKGKNHTSEAKQKMSNSLKGRSVWNKGKKGLQKAWNKGLKYDNQSGKWIAGGLDNC